MLILPTIPRARFLGKDNVSGETLDRLLHEKFAVANLFQKMLNVDADMSPDIIFNNTGLIKKLTGNDLHTGEFKYKKPFAFRNYAKLIFSCNKIPETEDLIDRLCTEEEFSGLLYELLCRLPRILREGIRKVTNEGMAETYVKYTRGSNPVKYFVERSLEIAVESKVTKEELFDQYEKFCHGYGLAPESPQSFSRKLKDNFRFDVKRVRIKGEPVYCWMGVRVRDWQKEEDQNLLDKLVLRGSGVQCQILVIAQYYLTKDIILGLNNQVYF